MSCFSTEKESKLSATLAEILWSVVHSICVLLVQRKNHFAKLFEANASIVLSVDFFEQQIDVVVIEITELQVVAKAVSQIVRCKAA